MKQEQIDAIVKKFGPAVKWIEGQVDGIPGKGWFLLEASPLPPGDELSKVVSDIIEDRFLEVSRDGIVKHLHGCDGEHKFPADMSELGGILESLQGKSFKVAIHPGIEGKYFGQPLAIPIDPVINYEEFPDHPHLNTGGLFVLKEKPIYLPDSLCYVYDIAQQYSDPLERYLIAFASITVWLLRHMIWEESRKCSPKGIWIGPQGGALPQSAFVLLDNPLGTANSRPFSLVPLLNPNGRCRCGNSIPYMYCHMSSDLKSVGIKELSKRDLANTTLDWKLLRQVPQDYFYRQLKALLAS